MAAAYLLSAAPGGQERHPTALLDLVQLRDSAAADTFGRHVVSADPTEADLVLFVETSAGAGPYFERVRAHPTYRQFRSKCYLFSATDKAVPLLPGVFASIERRWYRPAWTRSGHYLGVKEAGELRYRPGREPSRLFSFVGAGDAHRVRERVLALTHPDALIVDTRTAAQSPGVYAQSIADSAFVICPRGGGTATFRLFETMMLGRVPVIVSDQWVPPDGPDWETFSLRVRERDVERIPALLEAQADNAHEMGEAARRVWVDWFSPSASFHRIVEWCLDLARWAPDRTGARRFYPYVQMLRPYHASRRLAGGLVRGG